MPATFVRPWYSARAGSSLAVCAPAVLLDQRTTARDQESAHRLGLVSISQMLDTLVWAVENPADGVRILDVPKDSGVAGRMKDKASHP